MDTSNSYITSKIKEECRQKCLRIILNRPEIQYQIDTPIVDKVALIKQLLLKEQRMLKMIKINEKVVTELEVNEALEKRKRLINEEILEKYKELSRQKVLKVSHKPSTNKNIESKSREPFPAIQRCRLDKFLKTLQEKENLNSCQKQLKKCVADMNAPINYHWNLPINILKAIKDSILHRKWNNLTLCLLVLIRLPSYRYKPLIRHVS